MPEASISKSTSTFRPNDVDVTGRWCHTSAGPHSALNEELRTHLSAKRTSPGCVLRKRAAGLANVAVRDFSVCVTDESAPL